MCTCHIIATPFLTVGACIAHVQCNPNRMPHALIFVKNTVLFTLIIAECVCVVTYYLLHSLSLSLSLPLYRTWLKQSMQLLCSCTCGYRAILPSALPYSQRTMDRSISSEMSSTRDAPITLCLDCLRRCVYNMWLCASV